MTSFGEKTIAEEGFMPTFKVQGQIYHTAGSVLPLPNEDSKFLQISFMGNEQLEIDQRCGHEHGTRRDIALNIQRFLYEHNHLIQSFKTTLDRMNTDEYKIVIRADKLPTGKHERRPYNR
ncbi:hypothetical protein AVEN_154528-1 [Araneus ventricosus]|uniref:Helitron helicase-like domain-containing protein n=1 Tax=Araneus ventricosus TaxID=182803 RepID=A0A4Y2Q382_ARAVE|nr:hypothetical protein AVEN_28177-1 [Araneus ventricosus]GBN30739.1 hypothetical protein AVEN_200161-1 [Araneus ventricosus]GBN57999.1 hypothetical protein AVEN_149749-1 [Araneus ventricosus]GBN58018.1 hypothetical protein AVEN_154528-1 [Araneus ventricosus]